MKKLHLSSILLTTILLVGCTNKLPALSDLDSKDNSEYIGASEFIYDDEFEYIKTPVRSYGFETYESLDLYLKNEFIYSHHFYTIFPQKINSNMGKSFYLGFDNIEDNEILNPKVIEMFYIYDENLGTISDVSMDTHYYSMKFNCVFFSTQSDTEISDIKIEKISGSKLKVTLENNDGIMGYCYVYSGNLNVSDYIRDYLSKNLKRV